MEKIHKDIIKLIYEKGEGHLGSCLSCVEILQEIKEKMKDGDIFILSKAHAKRAVDVIDMPGQIDELKVYGGSLGNGIGIGLGLALSMPECQVYVLVGDGEMNEGANYEALKYIIKHDVNNIKIHVDYNGFSAYQATGHIFPNRYMKIHKTIKGKGIPELENTIKSHYHKITKEEMEKWCA